MNFSINRAPLFNALKSIIGIVERKSTQPILANILFNITGDNLALTATNIEMEVRIELTGVISASEDAAITLPARKIYELIATLPEDAQISFDIDDAQAIMKVGRSRYKLSVLSADDFPLINISDEARNLNLPQATLANMIRQVEFAMAQQDVRYYLNGMLIEIEKDLLTLVATDGHRLAKASTNLTETINEKTQIIVPRRTVAELIKSLQDTGEVSLSLAKNYLTLTFNNLSMKVKLIEGRFPEYQRVIPANMPSLLAVDKAALQSALARVAILANDKLRGVRLSVTTDSVTLTTSNPEQDEADEYVDASYNGNDNIITGYNLRYLQEALAVLPHENALLALRDASSACLINYELNDKSIQVSQVIMPMRL